MSDVINLDDRRKTKPAVAHVDRVLTVFGREYGLRRTFWSSNPARGWLTVRDARGEMMFARVGDLPDATVVSLIEAWMDGYSVGRKEAARTAARGGTGDIV
ncbi:MULTISPECIES: hypothetical protein [Bradyrhizobium]|jgi:hypothetical protein|uniref:Uncharacterized protein n=1 Tax=Bradyrhizobium elkanii TaxID=29448 RepID=A0A8I2C0Z8_BRAEL|nr:hypothetical protein [Bradyrhizobium elkanii]MBP1294290.1 hypothetical protein [Bradyrhizobium elkanii]